MKIIPFRIKPSIEEDDLSEVYEFLIKGSNRNAYEIHIYIDNFNDLGITNEICTCADFLYRQTSCKHIQEAKKILKEFKIYGKPKI